MVEADDAWAIELHDVAKTYGRKVQALRGVQLRVRRGEIFGLLGPNGAGKSTLVKIMMTIVRPDRAEGGILGRRVGHKPTLARVGYLPEHNRLPPYMTARQALEFHAALAKVPRRPRKRRAGELLDQVGLSDWMNKKVGTFSKGMTQRVGLAQAMVNDPELIVLDEPADGVDPVGLRDIRELLRHLRSTGKTIFLNSHMLGEVERVCDRAAILNRGQVVCQGSLDEMTGAKAFYQITILPDRTTAPDAMLRAVRQFAGVETDAWQVRVPTLDAAEVQPVIDALRREGLVIGSVSPYRQSLEDLFIEVIGDAGQPGGVGRVMAEAGGGKP